MIHSSKVFRQLVTLLCVLAFISIIMVGCGGKGTEEVGDNKKGQTSSSDSSKEDNANKSEGEVNKPAEISIMNIFHDTEPPKADNLAVKAIEEYTNTKLDITWVPYSAYSDKVNATIASGEIPQVLLVTANKSSSIVNAVRSGMFWEIGPYLKDYPNLSEMPKQVFDNISVDGKVYGVYRARTLARNGVIIRQDWLDNLGMAQPNTVEELIDVIEAFHTKDPNQNEKSDTYGIVEANNLEGLNHLAIYLGGPNGWGEKEGKLIPRFMTDEYKQAMDIYRQFYQDGILNRDFAAIQNIQKYDYVNKGQAGLYLAVLDDAASKHSDLYKLNSKANLDVIQPISGPAGKRVPATSGYNGVFMFSKTSIKTEEELKQILSFIDKTGDEDMVNLFVWGIEGKHYNMVDGSPSYIDSDLYTKDIFPIKQMQFSDDSKAMRGETAPLTEKYERLYVENIEYAIGNKVEPFLSQTNTERGSELNKIINDAKTKYVMGAIDEEAWEKEIERWHSNGGDKIIEEYNAEYAKTQ